MKKENTVLLVAAIGLFPIALSYGVSPANSLNWLLGIDVSGTELTHIFRAVMGLYLAMAGLWLVGAFWQKYTEHALLSMTVFMLGLAAGRLLSIGIDGSPDMLLWLYAGLEISFGTMGILLLRQRHQRLSHTQQQSLNAV